MKRLPVACLALSLSLSCACGVTRLGAEEGWIDLFNGRNLNNWVQRNGTATFRVEDGQIVGRTSEGSPNSFLCTRDEYGDFELTFEVKVDDALNSGVQIRSRSLPERDRGRVHGPQVEIATNGTAGYIYGEALGTGWLTPPAPHSWFKNGEWNHYRVVAQGNTIRTWLNGQPVAELVDDKTGMLKGFIGLQVHSIPAGRGPYEVRWRNIRIRPLP
ncbi:MAG: hypothetical protein KatS3mg109_0964 [Pirellulaceae bacterium]|nr:MAG: hypothetical protein KatS3mg109_0874 [Pirellulaceae bacterium]GIW90532.1 MAG: hypothetical protein KatS3mg109_0964 [Pirellulaceae bacterium]GIW94502.1 MAG: hypothetical protein KatS3mg110_2543 [Pirellulaceae bacterium]